MFNSRTESVGSKYRSVAGFADNLAVLVLFFQIKYLKNIVE